MTNREHTTPEPTMSAWAETRRHLMTPETIAANERLHAAQLAADEDTTENTTTEGVTQDD